MIRKILLSFIFVVCMCVSASAALLDPVLNFAKGTVSTTYDASATAIVLSSGDGANFPSSFSYNVVWWNATDYPDPSDDPNVEIVRVTGRSTDTLTVTRAQESTSATTKNTAGKVYQMILGVTKKTIDDIDVFFQPLDATLTEFSALDKTDSNFIVANGSAWIVETGQTVLTSIGLLAGNSITLDTLTLNVDDDFLKNTGDVADSGAYDFGGVVLEMPNGTSGTTDATGEYYLDTNGDTTNIVEEVVQIYNGTENKYLYPTDLPLAASQDNYVKAYDAATKTVQWEAQAGAVGQPDQDLWETITADSGTVAANTTTDTFDVGGGDGITTSISGDGVVIALSNGYVRLHESQSQGTHAGTFTTGSWVKRTVTEDIDADSLVVVTSSVIVLAAGTYDCLISCPAHRVAFHIAKLRNTTGASDVLRGTSEHTSAADAVQTRSFIRGRFTIAGSQNLEIQHRCTSTYATTGLGTGTNIDGAETFTVAEFWKVD